MDDFEDVRRQMVDCQVRTVDVTDLALLAALETVPREAFVPAGKEKNAYLDLDVDLGGGRYLMRPGIFARLVGLAEPQKTERVLLVGDATGYGAAVLARLAASVVSLDVEPALSAVARDKLAGLANVTVATGPLPDGYAAGAPYDLILVEGATETGLDTLLGQLADPGRLVAVDGEGGAAFVKVYTRADGVLSVRTAFNAAVKLLPGFRKAPAFVF
ncbi:protein-L-isoaspartate O-methyltransferase family protein [Segnochrobactraceae bacterium EtOH-i3]